MAVKLCRPCESQILHWYSVLPLPTRLPHASMQNHFPEDSSMGDEVVDGGPNIRSSLGEWNTTVWTREDICVKLSPRSKWFETM